MSLPPGVTLQLVAGGPNYYTVNGLTAAVAMGWDNPGFFPIGPWLDMLITQADADRWHDLGLNTAFAITGNSNISIAKTNGISVIQQQWDSPLPGTGSETVGYLTADEPGTFQDGVSTPISSTPNSVQDGHFWYVNNTWNFLAFGGLQGTPGDGSSTAVLTTPVNTPNGTPRHIDTSSIDIYWFAGAHSANPVLHQGGVIDGLGRDMTQDEAARGSNYGDMITQEIAFTNGAQPVFAFIEDGGPYTEDTTTSTYITPPELNWAVWSSLIHGARGIEYFNHTFGGPQQSDDNLAQAFYQAVQPGQTISIYNQVKTTDALVSQMAPVLNSPTALGYVTVNTPGFVDGKVDSLFSGIETMVKDDNGQFYIFADTRDSETQHNISATFTLNDPQATSVNVVGENRSITIVNGSFTDTFANASTVHIYQVVDNGPPPPPPPPAPSIVSFSPNTNGVDTTSTVNLTGTAEASSTVNVYDGTTSLGPVPVDANGNWTFTESNAANGTHTFTATDTDANGTSAASSAFPVTVNVAGPPPPPTNLVVNGDFETGNFNGWTLSGNVGVIPAGPQLFITSASHGGQDAAAMGSVGSDGTISENLTTVAGQAYTFDFWLANNGGNPNDFTAKIGGVTQMHLVNEGALGYTHYIFDFTATSTTTPVEFDFRQDPTEWRLDDVSVKAGTATNGLAVIGTLGNNTLTSPTGSTSDLFTGNGGADTFVFHGKSFGNAVITDFGLGTNHDVVQFDHTVFASFSAVKAHAAQVGSNTVITVDAHDSVTLLGISLSNLKSADFHFV